MIFRLASFILGMSLMPPYLPGPAANINSEGTLSDIDGNFYQTIKIGSQVWMAENLMVSRYRNGDSIPNVTDDKSWKDLAKGAWCYYDNEPANGKTYGKLYNWFAVNDQRGLCPQGWHVPTEEEWRQLLNYSGGIKTAGRSLRSDKLWYQPNEAASNSSGFTVLPSGLRYFMGTFLFLGKFTGLWSSYEVNNDFGGVVFFDCSARVKHMYYGKKNGFSCRCIMN